MPPHYRPELDSLRIFAAMMVVIHHAAPVSGLGFIHRFGWVGVDIFLALSGYLLTQIIRNGQKRGTFSMKGFLVRRALRILPLYLLFVTALGLGAAVLATDRPDSIAAWWVGHVLLLSNVQAAIEGYSDIPLSAHLWTISLELQLYGALALAVSLGISRIGFWRMGGALILILAALRFWAFAAGAEHPFIWTLPLRADAFILGGMAAMLRERWEGPGWLVLPGVGLLFSAALFPPMAFSMAYQAIGYSLAGLGAAVLVFAVDGRRILGTPILAYLGRISFGIYVFHLAGLWIAEQLVVPSVARLLLGAGITIALAALSYRYWERPFMEVGWTARGQRARLIA